MAAAQAPSTSGYIQQPSVCGDNVAFVAENDLWIVNIAGGWPKRMTNGLSASRPLFSPEGDCIAFAISSDIWILTAASVQYRRLTWFGAGEAWPVAFVKGSAELIFVSTLRDPFDRPVLYRVPLTGGEPTQLYPGSYDAIAFDSNGAGCCVGRHTTDPVLNCRWKGYRGGMHGFLWVKAQDASEFERLHLDDPQNPGTALNIACLMWREQRLWFAAEPDGSSNLWSANLEGKDLKKHTFHTDFDVRNAKAGASGVVYTHAGELWHLPNGVDAEARRINVEFGAPISHLPQVLEAEDWIDDLALHPQGHVCACICRGQVFEMAHWQGPAVRLTSPATLQAAVSSGEAVRRATRCHAMAYLHSGRLLTVTDELMPLASFTMHPSVCLPHADGEKPSNARDFLGLLMDDLGMAPHQMTLESAIGAVTEMVASPAHDAVLVLTGRNQLMLLEFVLEGGLKPDPQVDPDAKAEAGPKLETRMLDSSDFECGLGELCWSPDGEWIAYCKRETKRGCSLILLNIESGEKTVVQDSTFENSCPRFDPEGKFLTFTSSRTWKPREDDVCGDFSFAHGTELPYLILLKEDARNPFQRAAMSASQFAKLGEDEDDDEEEDDAKEDKDEDDDEKSDDDEDEDKFEPPKKIEIDIEGIQDRILQFPVSAGKYGRTEWAAEGKFHYCRTVPSEGCDDSDDEEDETYELFAYDMNLLKEKMLVEDVEDFHVSMDGEDMLVVTSADDETKYWVVVAGAKPWEDDEDDEVDMEEASPESGLVDIKGRVNLQVTPAEESAQIFAELCERVRESFFDEACGGLDWAAVCKRYEAVLPRLRCRAELTDLLKELLAELGVSHIFLSGPSDEEESPLAVERGHLGLRASWQELEGGGVYRVDEILKGDVWDPEQSGPLARAGVGITEGAYIVALNRSRVCKEVSLDQMLASCPPCEVFLTYVPVSDIDSFTSLMAALHKNGGKDGFRRLNMQQMKSMTETTTPTSKKKEKKKDFSKKKDENTPQQKKKKAADRLEKTLAGLLKAVDIDAADGPIWRTVRVGTADETVRGRAAMRDLVEARGRKTREASQGRVGYLHVPDTMHLGYAEFYRYFARESDREALIIDLRCNNGGYATELLLRQLRNVPIGWNVPRPGRGRKTMSPEMCTSGRLVLLIDEQTCSDGECWAEAFHNQKLGKIVGMRTWGGVVCIGGADFEFIDGAELNLPCEHYFGHNCGYVLENRGALPDIEVEWGPNAGADTDPQLEEGIAQALKLLEGAAPLEPEIPAFPRTRLHRRA